MSDDADPAANPLLALTGATPATPPRNELHAAADHCEAWMLVQELGRTIIEDRQFTGDRDLIAKASTICDEAETILYLLRIRLSTLPAQDFDDLARKARIFRYDCTDWLVSEDPLHKSLCDDILRLTGVPPIEEPLPISDDDIQRVRDADFASIRPARREPGA